MKLTDLNPAFVFNGGDGVTETATGKPIPYRPGVALAFDCPGVCGARHCVMFSNPLDGGPAVERAGHVWTRTGDTFETLKLEPSIRSTPPHGCGWHGYIGYSAPGNVDTLPDSTCIAK